MNKVVNKTKHNKAKRISKIKNDRLVYVALIAFGFSGKALEREYAKVINQNMSIDKLMAKFIKKMDNNLSSSNEGECQDGKCLAYDLPLRNN
jgi:Holliday junction resolvasome RuvABC DNA-binding subunit